MCEDIVRGEHLVEASECRDPASSFGSPRMRARRYGVTRGISLAVATCFMVFSAVPARIALASPIIHPGDTISVDVLNYDALASDPTSRLHSLETPSVLVADDGSVSLPVAGTFKVSGKSASQVASLIEAKLAPYVRDPAVNVRILEQNQVIFLTGATVGTLPFLPGETLSTALGQMRQQFEKGLSPELASADRGGEMMYGSPIDLRKVVLARDDDARREIDGETLLRSGLPGPTLAPGDTLLFTDKPIRVLVRGEVVSPGATYLYPEETLEQALLAAGGPLPAAATSTSTLLRNGVETPLPLGGAAIRQSPQDGDELIVRAAPHVSVLGQVENPGELTLKNGSSLLVALYAAGGPTRWGNVRGIEVIHAGATTSYDLRNLQHGDLSANVNLADGDVVYVPEGHAIDGRLIFQGILGGFGALTGLYDAEHL